MTKKLRPFKNFAEFKRVTGRDIGTAITTCFKDGSDVRTRLIVSYNDGVHRIGLGVQEFSYKEILDNYLLYIPLIDETEPLGVEEEEPETENVKPAKFKVGQGYLIRDTDNKVIRANTVIAKFKDPRTHSIKVVLNSHDVCFVDKDDNGNEFFIKDNFENCSAEDVIKSMNKEKEK